MSVEREGEAETERRESHHLMNLASRLGQSICQDLVPALAQIYAKTADKEAWKAGIDRAEQKYPPR